MKKYFFLAAIFVFTVAIAPQTANAQWTNPFEYYRRNEIIINGTKKTPIRKNTAKKGVSPRRKAANKKIVRKKIRRVAALEFINEPTYRIDSVLPKRIFII